MLEAQTLRCNSKKIQAAPRKNMRLAQITGFVIRAAREKLQGFPSRLQLTTAVVKFPRTLDTRIRQLWETSAAMCTTAD